MADLLKFQIQHITSRRLQRELFEAFAPALRVDWEGLPQVEKERGINRVGINRVPLV